MNVQEDRLAHRCDRCGVTAKVRVQVSANLELLFCQHHADVNKLDGRYPSVAV